MVHGIIPSFYLSRYTCSHVYEMFPHFIPTVCFDGKDVWAVPRCRRAITCMYNMTSLDRRSLTYENRLLKYSKRGFAVAVPGLDFCMYNSMMIIMGLS